MADSPPQVIVIEKKRGLGCFGCGCLVLSLFLLLIILIIGSVSYVAYSKFHSLTSATPATVQTFDGGDDVYHGALQKWTDFGQAVDQRKPASLHLNADEINTLIARSPALKEHRTHAFVTINGDEMEIKMSMPTDILKLSILKGRYINGSITSGIEFDPSSKTLHVLLKQLQVGPEAIPKDYLPTAQQELDAGINQALQNDANMQSMMGRIKSLEIANGELVIETE